MSIFSSCPGPSRLMLGKTFSPFCIDNVKICLDNVKMYKYAKRNQNIQYGSTGSQFY